MRVLLDTNIIIHREANAVINPNIGILFNWLDQLKYEKCIHPVTVSELEKHSDKRISHVMSVKAANYNTLKTIAPLHDSIKQVSAKFDITENDINDTTLLNELFCNRVDILISEDKKIHAKAAQLGLADRTFKINQFLEKVTKENPDLIDYKVLSIKKVYFGEVELADIFFDSFREDYKEFDKWYNKKSDESAYICYNPDKSLSAFLYIKPENSQENYSDISPPFPKKKRLKIGTLKVTKNGIKIGERFLKIVFDNALLYKVEEIYVTIFDKRSGQKKLIELLQAWGFIHHGVKAGVNGNEQVYIKSFNKNDEANIEAPKLTFPFLSKKTNIFIVPIYPAYHTELFPDSILNTESPREFIEQQPHRNSLSKSYISHSRERNLKSGDIILFYRTGDKEPKIYSGVATTIGVVETVFNNIKNFDELLELTKNRTALDKNKLKEYWDRYSNTKPFVVNFLYAYSLPKRPNLKQLNEIGVIPDIKDMPRGFRQISRDLFIKLAKFSFKK